MNHVFNTPIKYLHNNNEYVEFWKKYFNEYPLLDSDRFESSSATYALPS